MHSACGTDPVCRWRSAAPSIARHADLGTLLVQHGARRAHPARCRVGGRVGDRVGGRVGSRVGCRVLGGRWRWGGCRARCRPPWSPPAVCQHLLGGPAQLRVGGACDNSQAARLDGVVARWMQRHQRPPGGRADSAAPRAGRRAADEQQKKLSAPCRLLNKGITADDKHKIKIRCIRHRTRHPLTPPRPLRRSRRLPAPPRPRAGVSPRVASAGPRSPRRVAVRRGPTPSRGSRRPRAPRRA